MNISGNQSDAILAKARTGDRAAVDHLLNSYRNYLKLLAHAQIGVQLRVKVDPSDLVQETLADAYQDFAAFQGSSGQELAAWLRKIMARNLMDQIKRHRAERRDIRREQSLEAALDRSSEDIAAALGTGTSSPSVKMSRHEQSVALANALAKLSADHREVIVRRQVERMPSDEIGHLMGRSSGAVRMLWARGLESLRRELENLI